MNKDPIDDLQEACFHMLGLLNKRPELTNEEFGDKFGESAMKLAKALDVFKGPVPSAHKE